MQLSNRSDLHHYKISIGGVLKKQLPQSHVVKGFGFQRHELRFFNHWNCRNRFISKFSNFKPTLKPYLWNLEQVNRHPAEQIRESRHQTRLLFEL